MDGSELQSSGDALVEGHDPPYDGAGMPTQEDGHSDSDSEGTLSSISTNSSIVSSPNERRPGLGAVKGLGWSGLSYDDYDIITVHGIRDDYRTAWTDKDGQWWARTQLFGGLETRQLDYSYEIDEQATIYEQDGIFLHAQALIEQLSANREALPETEVDRPVLWLCHDIGGIIAKQAMIIALSHPEKYGKIGILSTLVVFLGTPHQARSEAELNEQLYNLIHLPGPPIVDRPLRKLGMLLDQTQRINQDFATSRLLQRVPVLNVFPKPASEDANNTSQIPFSRYTQSLSRSWCYVHSFESSLGHADLVRGGPKEDWRDWVASRLVSPPRSFLQVFYHALPFQSHIFSQVAPSQTWGLGAPMGRDLEIANWIRSQPAFEMFNMPHLQSMTIHLHGNGNPLLSIGRISKYCFHEWSEGDQVGGVFFEFDQRDSRYDNMAAMLLCFINTMQWRFPHYDTDELKFLKDTCSFTVPDLYRIYKSYRSRLTHVVFFISCFDQCPADQRAWFLEQMHLEQTYCEWPYFLVVTTSSAEGLGLELPLSSATINIEECPALNPKESADSQMANIQAEFSALLANRPIFAEFHEDIRRFLHQCNHRPYLGFGLIGWLASHKQGLTRNHVKEIIDQLSTPNTENLLQAILSCVHETERRKRARLVFNWIKHAAEPWTVDALAEAVALAFTLPSDDCAPFEDLRTSELVRDILDDFGGVIEISKNQEVVFTHHEFFDVAEIDVQGDSDERACRVHGEIAEVCLRYFWLVQARERSFSLDPSLMGRGPWETPLDAAPMGLQTLGGMARYATLYWPKHYRASGEFGPSELVLQLLSEHQVRGVWEVPFYTLSNPFTRMQRSYVSPLPTLVMLGLDRVVMKQLEMDEAQPNFEEDCWLAVSEAARANSPEILDCLLKRVTLEGEQYGSHLEHALFWAAASGTAKRGAVDVLLEWIPDSVPIPWSSTVVHRAAAAGLEKMLERVFGSDYDMSTPSKYWQSPITTVAAWWNQPGSVKLLLSKNFPFNLDETDGRGFTALKAAVEYGNPRLVEAVLAGMSLGPGQMDVHDKQGIVSTAVDRKNHEALRLILKAGANSNGDVTYEPSGSMPRQAPLVAATCHGARECVRLLLTHGADPNIECNPETALYHAVNRNDLEIVRLLLESDPKADINRVPESASSLLMTAAADGYTDVAALLIEHGAEIDMQEPNGSPETWRTPLARAAGNGHLDTVKLLLERGATLDLAKAGSEAETPLFAAAYNGHTEIAQLLLDAGADPNWKDKYDWTCLHASYDQPSLVKAICEKGVNIDAQSDRGTALHIASRRGFGETLAVLLKQTPRPDIDIKYPGTTLPDESGFTALLAACYWARAEAVRILLQEGADPHVQGDNGDDAVDCVVAGGEGSAESIKCLALLLPRALEKHGKAYRIDKKGNTSLHKVVENTTLETVQYLIRETRMPIDLLNEEEYTPLACAIRERNATVAFHLIQLGARVNLVKPDFGSLLHLAVATGQIEVVKQLYRAGADPLQVHPAYGRSLLYTVWDMEVWLDDSVTARRMIRYLIDEQHFPVDQEGGKFGYPLIRAVLQFEDRTGGRSAMLRTLLRRKVDLSVADRMGRRAAHTAAIGWYDYALRALVKRCADQRGVVDLLTARDRFGRLPLHFAAAVQQDVTVAFLLKLRNKHKAALKEDIVDAADADGWTPLLWAAQSGNIQTVDALVKAGASLWTRGRVQGSDVEWSALKLANFGGRDDDVKELLTPKEKEREDYDEPWDDDFHKCRRGFERDTICEGCYTVIIGTEWSCQQCDSHNPFRLCFKCARLRSEMHNEDHTFEELGPMYAEEGKPPAFEDESRTDSEGTSGGEDEGGSEIGEEE